MATEMEGWDLLIFLAFVADHRFCSSNWSSLDLWSHALRSDFGGHHMNNQHQFHKYLIDHHLFCVDLSRWIILVFQTIVSYRDLDNRCFCLSYRYSYPIVVGQSFDRESDKHEHLCTPIWHDLLHVILATSMPAVGRGSCLIIWSR
jgi:hypothetical protein